MATKKHKQRTYARNRVVTRRGNVISTETDGQYLLKLVLVVLLGTFWVKFQQPFTFINIPVSGIPVGMLFGLLLVGYREKSQYDRKIWYAILILVTIISYFLPAGIVI
jgi:Na+-translocating ferredoxin:NAD+ oxidoreductase RnfD subunit